MSVCSVSEARRVRLMVLTVEGMYAHSSWRRQGKSLDADAGTVFPVDVAAAAPGGLQGCESEL